jgi:hypothetical protein
MLKYVSVATIFSTVAETFKRWGIVTPASFFSLMPNSLEFFLLQLYLKLFFPKHTSLKLFMFRDLI